MKHLLWGITLLGAGMGVLAFVLLLTALSPIAFGSFGWPLFGALGWAFLVWDPRAFGKAHVRFVWASFGMAIAAVAIWAVNPYVFGMTLNAGNLLGQANIYRTQLPFATLFAIVACASIFLATLAIQDRLGRWLLAGSFASAVLVQVSLFAWLNGALSQALLTATTSPAFPNALDQFPGLWQRVGFVSALPLLVYLVPFERLYWRLRQTHFRGASLVEV
jgi:hypothetical protein